MTRKATSPGGGHPGDKQEAPQVPGPFSLQKRLVDSLISMQLNQLPEPGKIKPRVKKQTGALLPGEHKTPPEGQGDPTGSGSPQQLPDTKPVA